MMAMNVEKSYTPTLYIHASFSPALVHEEEVLETPEHERPDVLDSIALPRDLTMVDGPHLVIQHLAPIT